MSSTHGSSEKLPYLAASNARSIASMLRPSRTRLASAEACSRGSSAARLVNRGGAETVYVTDASVPCPRMFCTRRTNSGAR
ncbi:MAG: hypothetical protein AUI11_10030 [Acidobacteria bacterium 13_2_20CM_2_66_4]|nr:MAG: hypothetical protein AUI11_10030 [Acidobacteria bacterium 13_2_20CM_2_66_4]